MKLEIWHNILWANYKARVFSALADICSTNGVALSVFQIAETESDRVGLRAVDPSLHRYPYVCLFEGAYSAVPKGRLIRTLATKVAGSDADLVVLTGYNRIEYWAQAVVLRLRGRRFAVFCDSTIHDQPQTTLKSVAKRLFFGMSDAVFCYGERAREYIRSFGVADAKIHTRVQAAALPADYDAATALAERIRLAPSPEAPVFLYVGRLSPEKRIDTLLRAFREVADALPGARLDIVGQGPQRGELEALAGELGLGERARFLGSRPPEALREIYASATCLVLPSWSEPWGLVVNEALHFGCPVVVSHRCGCVPELVENSRSGEVFPCDDLGRLVERLIAAPRIWADAEATAVAALDRVAPFNSERSARQIYEATLHICGTAPTS